MTLPLDGGWFGDAEPEDAWCPTDATPALLDNLARRLFALGVTRTALTDADAGRAALVRRWEALNVLAAYAERHADDRSPPELLRLALIRDDLEHVRRRLEGGSDG